MQQGQGRPVTLHRFFGDSGSEADMPAMKKGYGTWVALLATLLVLLALKYRQTIEGVHASVFTCQHEIKKLLRDPESAQFTSNRVDGASVWSWKSTGNIQRSAWTVRTKNGFGSYVLENMTCWFDEEGNFQRVTPG